MSVTQVPDDGSDGGDVKGAVPLTEPVDGVPPVITDGDMLRHAADELRAGTGPVALDTERASGYRYSHRAYLVQLRREGTGTLLVDPIALGGDVAPLADALAGTEWVVHAATQDLPCLAELGLRPDRLFDTELGGRLAGFPRVALGTLVEQLLGYALEKGHSAADWSRRPLPYDWLVYAALDVELLVSLRDVLEKELARQGKLEWALQEFEAVRTAPPPAPRSQPWRRTSGIHKIRTRRGLAAVRALWETRERIAARQDVAPGRVLPDRAIVDAVLAAPTSEAELVKLPVFRGRVQRRSASTWTGALRRAAELPEAELPEVAAHHDGPPAVTRWADRDPAAAARLSRVRSVLSGIAQANQLPVENLLSPELVRRLCWESPADHGGGRDGVAARLVAGGARRWQVELTAGAISEAVVAASGH